MLKVHLSKKILEFNVKMETSIPSYQFRSPCTVSVSGPTSCGKTHFVKNLILNKNSIFEKPPSRVVYFYSIWQDIYNDMRDVQFIKGLPDDLSILTDNNPKEHLLCILDDLMIYVTDSKQIQDVFIKESHHRNISIIYINQNMFYQGKFSRNINLNSMYLVLFKNPRDVKQISVLSSQLGLGKLLIEAYKDALKFKYGYILIDLSPQMEHVAMLRTQIFPNQDMIMYS